MRTCPVALAKLYRTTPAGFEPAPSKRNRFLICRRNHLAIAPDKSGEELSSPNSNAEIHLYGYSFLGCHNIVVIYGNKYNHLVVHNTWFTMEDPKGSDTTFYRYSKQTERKMSVSLMHAAKRRVR